MLLLPWANVNVNVNVNVVFGANTEVLKTNTVVFRKNTGVYKTNTVVLEQKQWYLGQTVVNGTNKVVFGGKYNGIFRQIQWYNGQKQLHLVQLQGY